MSGRGDDNVSNVSRNVWAVNLRPIVNGSATIGYKLEFLTPGKERKNLRQPPTPTGKPVLQRVVLMPDGYYQVRSSYWNTTLGKFVDVVTHPPNKTWTFTKITEGTNTV